MTPKKEDKLQEVAHPANARIHTLMTQLYPRYLTFIIIIIVIIIIIITIAKSYSPFIKQGVSFLILPLFLSLIYNFISFFILSSLCISLFVQLFLIEFMKCTRNTLAKEKKKKMNSCLFFTVHIISIVSYISIISSFPIITHLRDPGNFYGSFSTFHFIQLLCIS